MDVERERFEKSIREIVQKSMERRKVSGIMEKRDCDSDSKKRGARGMEDDKGITLIPTAYKIYAMVLAERLREEMEEEEMLPKGQAGFRIERGLINNVYTLNYVVERGMKRGEKVMAMCVDLKAAFDSVDRGILARSLEERGVSERLRARIIEIYEETRSVVRR